jgi:hypothetical protein
MQQLVITAKLRPGSETEVRKLLLRGPSFELHGTGLDRHAVFLAPEQLVLLFEGERADEEAASLLERSGVLQAGSRLAGFIEGELTMSQEVFSWSRAPDFEGISFGPQPGPGDSEGGGSD